MLFDKAYNALSTKLMHTPRAYASKSTNAGDKKSVAFLVQRTSQINFLQTNLFRFAKNSLLR